MIANTLELCISSCGIDSFGKENRGATPFGAGTEEAYSVYRTTSPDSVTSSLSTNP